MVEAPALLSIDVAFRSDVGQTRRHNEDFAGYYEPDDPHGLALRGRLYIVADGVGGAAAGEVASRYSVRKVLADYFATAPNETGEIDLEARLTGAIQVASADIYHFSTKRTEPMATTLVAALVHGGVLTVLNVGDSRAYLLRGDEIRQITEDHSLVAQRVRQGTIAPEDAASHPQRNLLTRTVGGSETVEVDVFGGPLLVDDTVLLCSDGLTRYVNDAEIADHVRSRRPQQAVDDLVALANKRGGKDNITVLVLQVVEPSDDLDTEPRARHAPPRETIETPDLEEELARSIVEKQALFTGPWGKRKPLRENPMGMAAIAVFVVGMFFLIVGGVWSMRNDGGAATPATPSTVPAASAVAPTQTPDARFEEDEGSGGVTGKVAVRFVANTLLREEPGASTREVAAATEGQRAELLGGPAWDAESRVWWLLKLTQPDGQSVTGWAMQSALEAVP